MVDLSFFLNPSAGLSIPIVLGIALVLGVLHGATPDEHTWPITFSYSIGSYSSRGGMKAGLVFSTGFTIQRAILTTLGFHGLATIYTTYQLDGPVYLVVGFVMFLAGWYLLWGSDIHLPFDHLMERAFGRFFPGHTHHRTVAEREALPEDEVKPVPLRMAAVHGFVAGWGFGAYSTIIVFLLAPQMPNAAWAALVGGTFGVGTMLMQMITGAVFARLARLKRLSDDQVKRIGRSTAARTLYVGGLAFAVIGAVIVAAPTLNGLAFSTGSPIPNLDSIGVAFVLIVTVVGLIGGYNLWKAYGEVRRTATGPVADPPDDPPPAAPPLRPEPGDRDRTG